MTTLTYNLSVAAGTLAVAAGAWVLGGAGWGLVTGGALVLANTWAALAMMRGR